MTGPPDLVRVDGFHAVKHALRFGAHFDRILIANQALAESLAASLAPDIAAELRRASEVVTRQELARQLPRVPHTQIVGYAARPLQASVTSVSVSPPCVVLDDPRHLGNVGAVVRVTAGIGGGGVFTLGASDPWHPAAVRGSAGLHFALPVGRIGLEDLVAAGRPMIALDPDGDSLLAERIPDNALLILGSERAGIDPETMNLCTARYAIPLRHGISSYNLATAAAMCLYHWRLTTRVNVV